jgi:hypothetical protein
MKIFEVTGQQPQQMTKMKVIQATPNKVTLQDPNNPQTQTTFDPSKNPNTIQQGPQGVMVNPTADPNAPSPMPQLQPGSEVNMAGGTDAPSQPGSPLTPNPKPQDQAATEEIFDEPQATTPIAGLSRRTDKAGNTTDRYQAGPIDMSMTKNAQGQPVHTGGTYRVNKNASISTDTPFNNGQKGITKMVGQAADPDDIAHLMGTDASAQRMGVDPRAFAKFQQGLPREDYVPTGYNDKNREKAMMRKAMQQITQDKKFVGETNDIVALARRVSNIQPKANTNQSQDVINLKKLAGL